VQVKIQTPGKLTKRQKELLHELDTISKVENHPERKTLLGKVKDIFG
jgi:molecular chaperone DnaJ